MSISDYLPQRGQVRQKMPLQSDGNTLRRPEAVCRSYLKTGSAVCIYNLPGESHHAIRKFYSKICSFGWGVRHFDRAVNRKFYSEICSFGVWVEMERFNRAAHFSKYDLPYTLYFFCLLQNMSKVVKETWEAFAKSIKTKLTASVSRKLAVSTHFEAGVDREEQDAMHVVQTPEQTPITSLTPGTPRTLSTPLTPVATVKKPKRGSRTQQTPDLKDSPESLIPRRKRASTTPSQKLSKKKKEDIA